MAKVYKNNRGRIFTVNKGHFAEVSDANVKVVWWWVAERWDRLMYCLSLMVIITTNEGNFIDDVATNVTMKIN